jgi:integrase
MILKFESKFSLRLKEFIELKNSLGYIYRTGYYVLLNFDKFCLSKFPNELFLTKELGLAWAKKPAHMTNHQFAGQLSPIREFAKFLIRKGENAFVIPIFCVNYKYKTKKPYIYTEEQIMKIWSAFDELKPTYASPVQHIVLPAVIRIIYCCGLRPCETRRLKVNDVDLETGKIFICESKMNKDRIIMTSDDVLEYLKNYNETIRQLIPNRIWFFPSSISDSYSKWTLFKQFRIIKMRLNLFNSNSRYPRVYDFRHSFATHRLYKWLNEKKNLSAYLPYLSAYMGHANISDTYYYISLVPDQLKVMSGLDFSKYESILPEVEYNE